MRHGFLLIDKPEGPTSHAIVDQVRSVLHERDIGHLGTLDPLASGLLVLAVGSKALKVVELFGGLSKEYRAAVRFGAVSATYDREGPIEEVSLKPGVSEPTPSEILELIRNRFLGEISQVPPAASAISIGGERAYRKMRQGRGVDLPTRTVRIHSCDIVSYAYPDLVLNVQCGSGTYIRSLAHDLGQMLRCGAYLSALDRTMVGDWKKEDAVAPDQAKWTDVLPLKDVLQSLPGRVLTQVEFTAISQGRVIEGTDEKNTIGWLDELPVALLEPSPKTPGIKARKVL